MLIIRFKGNIEFCIVKLLYHIDRNSCNFYLKSKMIHNLIINQKINYGHSVKFRNITYNSHATSLRCLLPTFNIINWSIEVCGNCSLIALYNSIIALLLWPSNELRSLLEKVLYYKHQAYKRHMLKIYKVVVPLRCVDMFN